MAPLLNSLRNGYKTQLLAISKDEVEEFTKQYMKMLTNNSTHF